MSSAVQYAAFSVRNFKVCWVWAQQGHDFLWNSATDLSSCKLPFLNGGATKPSQPDSNTPHHQHEGPVFCFAFWFPIPYIGYSYMTQVRLKTLSQRNSVKNDWNTGYYQQTRLHFSSALQNYGTSHWRNGMKQEIAYTQRGATFYHLTLHFVKKKKQQETKTKNPIWKQNITCSASELCYIKTAARS